MKALLSLAAIFLLTAACGSAPIESSHAQSSSDSEDGLAFEAPFNDCTTQRPGSGESPGPNDRISIPNCSPHYNPSLRILPGVNLASGTTTGLHLQLYQLAQVVCGQTRSEGVICDAYEPRAYVRYKDNGTFVEITGLPAKEIQSSARVDGQGQRYTEYYSVFPGLMNHSATLEIPGDASKVEIYMTFRVRELNTETGAVTAVDQNLRYVSNHGANFSVQIGR